MAHPVSSPPHAVVRGCECSASREHQRAEDGNHESRRPVHDDPFTRRMAYAVQLLARLNAAKASNPSELRDGALPQFTKKSAQFRRADMRPLAPGAS
jgi:hypothetical protein